MMKLNLTVNPDLYSLLAHSALVDKIDPPKWTQYLDICLNQWIKYNQILTAVSSYAMNLPKKYSLISKAITAKQGDEPGKVWPFTEGFVVQFEHIY